jgi:hypothetical protein
VKLLLADAEKWHTQATTGVGMTQTQAQQDDQSASNLDAIEQAKRMVHQRAEQGAAGGSDA